MIGKLSHKNQSGDRELPYHSKSTSNYSDEWRRTTWNCEVCPTMNSIPEQRSYPSHTRKLWGSLATPRRKRCSIGQQSRIHNCNGKRSTTPGAKRERCEFPKVFRHLLDHDLIRLIKECELSNQSELIMWSILMKNLSEDRQWLIHEIIWIIGNKISRTS